MSGLSPRPSVTWSANERGINDIEEIWPSHWSRSGELDCPRPLRRVWPAQARHLAALRSELRRWVAPLALTEDAEDDLVLASSEAASNCIEHAYRPTTVDDIVEVRYWTDAQAVFVEIIDHGRWQTPSGRSTGRGRGIGIMQRLMAGVEIHHDTRGTRVLLYQPLPDGRCTAPAPRRRRREEDSAQGQHCGT